MSLPLIIFFERHWDIIPKAVMQKLLPKLEKNGYNTFCIEAPHNISSQEILKRHHQGLKDDTLLEKQAKSYLRSLQLTKELSEISFTELASLIRLYVSSQHFITVAEKIKQLPASRMLKENFIEASKRSFMIKGIDINSKEYDHLVSLPLSERVVALDQLEIKRIETFSQHLIFLKNEQKKGVIFACGAKHAKSLISELKKYEEEGEVLYYFPHSASRYDESLDDVAVLLEKNDGVLEGHTYCLTEETATLFAKRVVNDIGAKIIDHKKLEKKTSYFQYFIDCIRSPFHQGVYSGQAKGKGGEGSPPSSGIKSEFDKKI